MSEERLIDAGKQRGEETQDRAVVAAPETVAPDDAVARESD